ncbi:hypothetical protein BUALT_Bualt12G0009100 [Buddleja alternifolia]|uniref:Leucine-rich repeat-containing N-terminal plant-type domain-containing protein n=1 Tax=Buddleja alternifolia TaxID=168488 RepID=A0AAV6WW41_9LAMI|nr:hypothetical protein BUALT_Bualt12G0009100 [Buddleja alternifolia]
MKTSQFFTFFLVFLTFFSLTFSKKCHPDDKKTLLKIKKDFNNDYVFASWDPKTDCCGWYIVKCDPKTNRIIGFDLSQSDLKLPMPSAIGDLPYLESLSFHHTNLTGQIPQSITKLSKLKFLDLKWNFLSGPIPSFLGELKNLDYLALSFNNFTGPIPSSLSKLTKLTGLLLDRNKLTGKIPESFSQFQANDFYLYLSHNQLSGQVPRTLGHVNFSWIDISRNKLEGDISFLFGKDKFTNIYDFSRNMLQFDMSKLEFPKTMTKLDLNHNKIFGSLPKDLAKFDYLNLNVSYNRLCGKIPVSERLQELDYTNYFHNKCLCGAPLPACK